MSYQNKLDTVVLLYGSLRNAFEELFFDEIESWFTADVACCAGCYKNFCERWPLIAQRDDEFRSSFIELSYFYENSRLRDVYKPEEFDEYAREVFCPVCGESLAVGNGVYVYNFPRYIPPKYRDLFDEVGQLAASVPFLILEHEFAQCVLKEIRAAGAACSASEPAPRIWYRAREATHLRSRALTEFGPPAPENTREGRYNHAGKPVLYLGSDPGTCKLELGSPVGGVVVAELEFRQPIRMLDLRSKSLEGDVLPALIYSALLSSPEKGSGWDQPQYAFSRFVRDCALVSGFDTLLYPSTRTPSGDNLVVLDGNLFSTHLQLLKFIDLK